jgi:dihydroxyacetone kinase-like predicted kinase
MNEALAAAATGEVTVASRDATLDGISIREGAYLGLVDGEAVAAADDLESVTLVVVERLLDGGRGWLGVLVGADAPPIDGLLDAVRSAHPDVELERHEGGQPHYPLLLVAE